MIRVRWELEEAVALMNLYFRYGATLGVPNDELLKLSQIYRNRANILGLNVDDKFRNEDAAWVYSLCCNRRQGRYVWRKQSVL